MSGRGKGGKGLAPSKKAKVAAPDPYAWTEGEEAALVCLQTDDDSHPSAYVVAWGQLHPYIAIALTAKRQHGNRVGAPLGKRLARLELSLCGDDDNDDLFNFIKAGDVAEHRGETGGEEADSDEEVDDRKDVVNDIEQWLISKLDFWKDEPEAAIKIRGAVCIH